MLFGTKIAAYSENDNEHLGITCRHGEEFLSAKANGKYSNRSVLNANANCITQEFVKITPQRA